MGDLPVDPRSPTHAFGRAPAPSSHQLRVLPRSGKFVRVRMLGSGGFGEVWQAWDTELERWVALKFPKGSGADEMERLRREARLAGTLSHPHIASVYEIGEAQDRVFIAMQYVEGETLASGMRPTREIVELLRDAARAIHVAHGRGVVHRDVKPENLMVARGTDPPHVYVMDFGLARSTRADTRLSATGIVMGTPGYMAPEQILDGRLDARTDVFGLGATLYHLLAGRRPFPGRAPMEILQRTLEGAPIPLRRFNPSIPPDLDSVVLRCLEKEPAHRYGTAAELAEDLDQWLRGEPVTARPPSAARRAAVFIRRNRLAVSAASALAATALVAVVALPGWWSARAEAERSSRERAQAEKRLQEASVFGPLEKDLDLLRMKFYQPDYRLDDVEVSRYSGIEQAALGQMERTGPSAAGWLLVGRARDAQGDSEGAIEALDRALGREPDHPPALIAAGRLALKQAFSGFLLARESDRTRKESAERVRIAVHRIRKGAGLARDRASALELQIAEVYLKAVEGWPNALDFDVAGALKAWPGEPRADEFLLVAAMGSVPRDRAVWARRHVEKAPSSFEGWFWLGVGQRRSDPDASAAAFQRALQINPGYAEANMELGVVHLTADRLREAEACFDRAIALDPRSAPAYINRSTLYLRTGALSKGLQDARRAVELDPGLGEAVVVLGELLWRTGDLDGAAGQFDRAVRDFPRLAVARTNRGALRMERNDPEGAVADFTEALALDPQDARAWRLRALCRGQKNQLDDAHADLKRAIALDPGRAVDWTNLGVLDYQRKKFKESLAAHDKALELDPRVSQYWANRAHTREALGDFRGAAGDFRKALELAPVGERPALERHVREMESAAKAQAPAN